LNIQNNELEEEFNPTFTGGRQERAWIRSALAGFYEDRWFTDVLYRVKGGKEATVYCCRGHPVSEVDLIAAKVFRPRMFRAMKNDTLYKSERTFLRADGKTVLDRRRLLALQKGSAYGKRLDAASWCRHEFNALTELYEAGADVPKPLAYAPNAILMEFVGDDVQAAPILQSIRLEQEEAETLFERLVENIEILLSRYVVHGDLSAYNVLYQDGDAWIIDLPQTIDALQHPRGFELFARDVDRLGRYFVKQGVEVDAMGLALELWQRWIE